MKNRNNQSNPRRGEIWDVDFLAIYGWEQKGIRPVLIVQNPWSNAKEAYPYIIVVPVTRTEHEYLTHVRITPNNKNGLSDDSDVQCDQIFTIKKSLLLQKRGSLSAEEMHWVDKALAVGLALKISEIAS